MSSSLSPSGIRKLRAKHIQLDDAEQPWTFREKNMFDLIHARNLAQAINDSAALVKQMYEYTAPGGMVELAELGGTSPLPFPPTL